MKKYILLFAACLLGAGITMYGQSYKGTPHPKGKAHAVPGVIAAADFDQGGEGVSYHFNQAGKGNNKDYRSDINGGVAISGSGSKTHISDLSSGDWFKYTVDVKKAGTYAVKVYVGTAANEPKALSIEVDDKDNYTGSPIATSGWESFEPITIKGVELTKGKHVLKLTSTNGSININEIELRRVNNMF